jgi:hypothetical protein
MSKWEKDFSAALAVVEAAYANDRMAYDALVDDDKRVWALWPVRNWPAAHRDGHLAVARSQLIQAEDTVRDLVQRQSVAVRNARDRRLALYQRRAFAATLPARLALQTPAPHAHRSPAEELTARSRVRNPPTD